MTIPTPIAIPAMAPLPICMLLEELLVALLLEDDEGDEPWPEELLPTDVASAVLPRPLVKKDVTEVPVRVPPI